MPTKHAPVVSVLLCFGLCASAVAQPVVRVGSASRIDLQATREADSVHVQGRLLDDQGRPIEGVVLSIQVFGLSGEPITSRRVARTSNEGDVELDLPATATLLKIVARFAGDAFHAAAQTEASFDTARAPISLTFTSPSSGVVELDHATLELAVLAKSEASVEGIDATIEDEQGRLLASGKTDAQGVLRVALAMSSLGEPGVGALIARSAGDAMRADGRVELGVLRLRATQLELRAEPRGRASVRVRGALTSQGRGLARATVGVFDDRGEHLASVTTDELGAFDREIDVADRLPDGGAGHVLSVTGRFDSDVPWLGSSATPPAQVVLDGTRTIDLFWLIGTPVLFALILLWLRTRQPKAVTPTPSGAEHQAGLVLARSTQPTLGVASEHAITVVVLDARRGTPILGAELIDLDRNNALAASDLRGELFLRIAERGSLRVRFSAAGYRAFDCALRVPHRGEWTRAVVRLESLRDLAVRAWSPFAINVWRSEERARGATLRETAQQASAKQEIRQALARTEAAAYGRDAPSEDQLHAIEEDAQRTQAHADAKPHDARD